MHTALFPTINIRYVALHSNRTHCNSLDYARLQLISIILIILLRRYFILMHFDSVRPFLGTLFFDDSTFQTMI